LFKKLSVLYAKRGPAKHFGHLELVRTFLRTFRRARIPLRFSEGFHPTPKVSFESALPVGIESMEEHFVVEVPFHVQRTSLVARVNEQLPEGLILTACKDAFDPSLTQRPMSTHYTVRLKDNTFSERKLKDFLKSKEWPLVKTNRKGHTRTMDLKETIAGLRLVSPSEAHMEVKLLPGSHVNCREALSNIFGLSDRTLKLATIIKDPHGGDGNVQKLL
jgi:radical SAM-linked protein